MSLRPDNYAQKYGFKEDPSELIGDIHYTGIFHYGADSDPRVYNMSSSYVDEYLKFKRQADELAKKDDDKSKKALGRAQASAIACWNKLKPQQQRELAEKYLPKS